MLPYTCESYKDVLKKTLLAKNAVDCTRRLTFQGMSEHCGIQKTYLSKVLNHEGHLNEDQLFHALEYLGLQTEEVEFTLLLQSYERAQSAKRREILARTVATLRQQKVRTESNIKVETARTDALELLEYYLDPLYQVIHMSLTLKRFEQDPLKLAPVLHMTPSNLRKLLRGLQRMQIIRFDESNGAISKLQVLRDNLHLPQESVLHDAYASRMRLKSLERAESLDKNDAYRFSVIFSTDKKTRAAVHASFLAWLKKAQELVAEGSEEEVFQMNFDLLQWT